MPRHHTLTIPGATLHCYVISDTGGPAVAVSTPSASFSATAPCICASGTSTGATAVYCNTATATGTDTWTACANSSGVPVSVQADPKQSGLIAVTASATDANGNWAYAVVTGAYTGTITARVVCVPRALGK